LHCSTVASATATATVVTSVTAAAAAAATHTFVYKPSDRPQDDHRDKHSFVDAAYRYTKQEDEQHLPQPHGFTLTGS
jgi:hypothetical protein